VAKLSQQVIAIYLDKKRDPKKADPREPPQGAKYQPRHERYVHKLCSEGRMSNSSAPVIHEQVDRTAAVPAANAISCLVILLNWAHDREAKESTGFAGFPILKRMQAGESR
jgi:hypothetical protein